MGFEIADPGQTGRIIGTGVEANKDKGPVSERTGPSPDSDRSKKFAETDVQAPKMINVNVQAMQNLDKLFILVKTNSIDKGSARYFTGSGQEDGYHTVSLFEMDDVKLLVNILEHLGYKPGLLERFKNKIDLADNREWAKEAMKGLQSKYGFSADGEDGNKVGPKALFYLITEYSKSTGQEMSPDLKNTLNEIENNYIKKQ